ncbi:MAG: type IX secretion system sortase PorU, partial [Bacteroidales bacterium]
MRYIFTYLFLLSFLSGFAQKNTVPIDLTWEKPKMQFFSDTGKKQTLCFQNAGYNEEFPCIPFFKIKIPLKNDEQIRDAGLSDISYVALTPTEEIIVNTISDKIPAEINTKTEKEISKKSLTELISFLPLRKNAATGKIEKVIKANLNYEIISAPAKNNSAHQYVQNSALASGTWYKLKVKNNGIYKITYYDLVQHGIDASSIDPENIRIYGNGGEMLPESNAESNYDDIMENAIYVEGESDGHFDQGDYILFYGKSPVEWTYDTTRKVFIHSINYYSDETCYFLTYDKGPGKRIQSQNSSGLPATNIITKFNDYDYHEKDSVNLLKSGKEWYGEYFDITDSYNFNYTFPDIDIHSRAVIRANIAARNLTDTQFNILTGGNTFTLNVSAIPGQYTADYARFAEDTMGFFPIDSNVNITINKMTTGSIGWLNFIEINVVRDLNFKGHQMRFRNTGCISNGNITEFRMSNSNASIKLWDITNPFNIKNQQYSLNGSDLCFRVPTDSLREFIAFDNSLFLTASFEGAVQNQNLHALGKTDMIIITHPDFISQANRLADIHLALDNFSTIVVTPQEIYNEFSSGIQDVSAIRNFIRMLYDRASSDNDIPKYLLLFGDGSYDYKNRIAENTNYIPAYQSLNSLMPVSSYVTDDFFGLLDSTEGYYSNGALDIGIGRLPAKSIEEAKTLVDKIEYYLIKKSAYTEVNGCNTYTQDIPGDWRNMVCFIADDEDNNLHIGQAEGLATFVDTMYNNINIDKIYLDAYMQIIGPNGTSYPDVNKALNERVQKGALLINYTGHGGETGWAAEKVLQISDINHWKNLTNMPVFITATCDFSRFDDPSRNSAGEQVLLNPNGGGIALFSTTRLAFSNSNFNLNKSFCEFAFKTVDNAYYCLGDIIRLSKIDNGSISNIRNFVLLGDPALKLSYPENTVVTTTINGHQVNTTPDTLKALSIVTISGIIQNSDGQKLTDFNGTIYPTVYDKKIIATTLANDPQSSPYNFSRQNQILYKGKATVENGEFGFSFIIPKDMNENYGIGRISYYANNEQTPACRQGRDAGGYFENSYFIIGGIDSTAAIDNTGPLIKLFLNDTTFSYGGTTDKNPLLLAYIEDPNGILVTGNSFGHDITAVL